MYIYTQMCVCVHMYLCTSHVYVYAHVYMHVCVHV